MTDEQNRNALGASLLSEGLCVKQPTESLAEAYDKAMELQRARVAEHSRELEIAENHLRQLKETVAMKRNHHREVAGELRSMEELYAKWKTLTHNVK